MKKVSLRLVLLPLAPRRRAAPPDTPDIRTPAKRARRACVLAALCLVGVASTHANPPAGGNYSVPKQAIAAGGAALSGGSYTLVGTIGQSVAGETASSSTRLQQGFHAGQAGPDELFNNGFE